MLFIIIIIIKANPKCYFKVPIVIILKKSLRSMISATEPPDYKEEFRMDAVGSGVWGQAPRPPPFLCPEQLCFSLFLYFAEHLNPLFYIV